MDSTGARAVPVESIRKLVNDFSIKTGVEIKLEISGEANIQDSAANIAVYHIVQEAMTNSVRHGKAERISIRLDYSNESITFCIVDNGIGAETLKEGYGLKGIRERVEAFNGKLETGSSDGFYLKGIVYLEGKK